ncbi:MAG: DNA polymerase III subunit delta' [Bacillota bacterium]
MKFTDIIGQPVLVDSLKRAVMEDKAANGYIFYGPEGCGKKLTAFVFALALNCRSQDGEIPCERCSSCIKFNTGNHPNIKVVKPTGASIKIKQIRDVINEVSKTSFESGFKIIIIDKAEKMTHEAQDAFLKTLEEPPVNTVFMLLVENHHSLLQTVVSRCQVFPLKRVKHNDIEDFLRRSFNIDDAKVKLATAYSNGIIGRAVQILRNDSYFSRRENYIKTIMMLFEGTFVGLSNTLTELVSTREEAVAFLDFMLGWFRDVMVLLEAPEAAEDMVINIDKLKELTYSAEALTEKKLNSILNIITNTEKQLKHNVSIKNCMDVMILNIMEVNNG